MTVRDDLWAHARSLLDVNRYLTLGTVGPDGHPWTSPVYFAAAGLRDFYWVSAVDARHSVFIAERPRVSIVVFDSSVEPYHGRAVYAVGDAVELGPDDLGRALAVYPGGVPGAAPVTPDDVTGDSPYRMYHLTASETWVLCPREPRQPCDLHGYAYDHRARVVP